MQKNKELQELFSNYRNLSEEQLMQLLGLIVKQEKEKMKLSFPVRLEINYDDVGKNCAGGDSSLVYNDDEKRYEYAIRLNGQEWYKQYLANRGKVYQNGNMTFDASLDSLYNLIARLCHEMRHAYQNEVTSVKTDITDMNALTWLKEALVITDNEFYRKNYGNMSREIDAFNYQYQEALKYIKTYTSIELDNPEFFATLQKTLEINQQTNVKPLDELTFDVDGEQIKNTDYFNEHMAKAFQEYGITSEMLKTSILRYEYNPDRTKKTFEQLMQDKQVMIDGLDKTLSNYERQIEKIERIYDSIIQNDSELQLQAQQGKTRNIEQPLRSYLAQTNPEIEISLNYINYSEFQRTSDGKSQTEKRKNPLVINNKVVGELEEIEVYDFGTATSKTNRFETVESENGIYTIDTEIQRCGEQYSVTATMDVFNEISKSREKATYTRDMDGNETYTYMENGIVGQVIKKTERGTTIDIYKDGKPYATYEYDENGKALEPMGTMEQLPEDYVESCFRMPLPEYSEVQYQEPEQEIVSTQKLGKETLDLQTDIEKMQEVETTLDEHMAERQPQAHQQQTGTFEINEFGEIIRPEAREKSFKERMRVEVNSNDYAQEVLTQVEQDLESGTLDKGKKKKKEDYNPEKSDDDYIL